jgi:hypothetical protein
MANARGIRAGAAYVELFVNDSKLVRGLTQASKKLKAFGDAITGWGQKMTAIGAAVTAPLLGSAKAFAEMGDRIAKASARTGVSVETLSELAYAADLSGASLETLEGSLRKMQKAIVEAADGSASANDALGKLGLTVEDLRGLSPDQQFKLIADRLSQIQSPALKAALAMELFGKSGTQLLPLMADGAKGIDALQAQARALGLTMSTEDAKAAEALNDAFDTLWKVIKQGVFVIGSALAPTLKAVSEWIVRTVVTTTAWIKQNKDLVVMIFKVAAAVLAGGAALLALGLTISALGTVLGALAGVIGAVIVAFKVIVAVIGAMLGPIGLVIAAIAALGAYLIYVSGTAGQAVQWLGGRFAELSRFASDSLRGIADALMAGDIALAARILWLSLKLAWDNGVAMLQRIWLAFSGFFVKVGYGAFYGVLAAAEFVWHAMKVVWIEGVSFLRKLWADFTNWHAKAVEGTANAMVSAWIWAREQTGAIDADQAAFERDYVQKQHEMASRQIDQERNSAVADAERQRQAERTAETQRHEQRLAEIGKGYNDAEASVEAERAEKQRKTEEALAAARQEWQDAIAEARRKRQMSESDGPQRLQAPPDIADYLEGLGPAIEQAQQKATIGAAGTFSAMEARGLAGGGVTDRIASATEATAKHTKKLADKVRDGGLAFD